MSACACVWSLKCFIWRRKKNGELISVYWHQWQREDLVYSTAAKKLFDSNWYWVTWPAFSEGKLFPLLQGQLQNDNKSFVWFCYQICYQISWKCTSITCATSGMCYARHVQIKPRNHTKSLHTHIATIWFWNRGQGENTTEIVRELSRGHSNICWVHHYNCQPSIDDLGTLLNEAVHQHSQQAGYLQKWRYWKRKKRGKKVGQLDPRKTSTTNTPWSY